MCSKQSWKVTDPLKLEAILSFLCLHLKCLFGKLLKTRFCSYQQGKYSSPRLGNTYNNDSNSQAMVSSDS